MALEKYDVEDFYSGGLIAAERALSSGFLSVLDPTYDEVELIKISGDQDTEIIYGNRAKNFSIILKDSKEKNHGNYCQLSVFTRR